MNTTPVHSITPEMLTQSSKENPVITNASIAYDQLDMCHFMSEGQVVVFQENGAITVSQYFDMSVFWQDEYARYTAPLCDVEYEVRSAINAHQDAVFFDMVSNDYDCDNFIFSLSTSIESADDIDQAIERISDVAFLLDIDFRVNRRWWINTFSADI